MKVKSKVTFGLKQLLAFSATTTELGQARPRLDPKEKSANVGVATVMAL